MSNPGETLILRPARPEEHHELETVQLRASLELREYRDQLATGSDAIQLPHAQIANGQVIVAEINGQIAGFAAVVAGELDALFVEPDLWGRGIGRALVNAAVSRARQRGFALTAIVAPSARRFYESCGFSVEEETNTRCGPAFRMSK